MLRGKWSNIEIIDLGKTDQMLGYNKLSEHQLNHFVLCEFKNMNSLHTRILSVNIDSKHLKDRRKHLEKIFKDRNIRIWFIK
jgi:hypothetical protein